MHDDVEISVADTDSRERGSVGWYIDEYAEDIVESSPKLTSAGNDLGATHVTLTLTDPPVAIEVRSGSVRGGLRLLINRAKEHDILEEYCVVIKAAVTRILYQDEKVDDVEKKTPEEILGDTSPSRLFNQIEHSDDFEVEVYSDGAEVLYHSDLDVVRVAHITDYWISRHNKERLCYDIQQYPDAQRALAEMVAGDAIYVTGDTEKSLSEFVEDVDVTTMMGDDTTTSERDVRGTDDGHQIELITEAPEIGDELDFETRMFHISQQETIEDDTTAVVLDYHAMDETVDIRFRLPDDSHGRISYEIPDEKSGPFMEFLKVAHVDRDGRLDPIPLEEVHLIQDAVVPVKETETGWQVDTGVEVDYDAQIDLESDSDGERSWLSRLLSLGLILFGLPMILVAFIVSIGGSNSPTPIDAVKYEISTLWNRNRGYRVLLMGSAVIWITVLLIAI